ncbi:type IV pilin-like G/H family protein [Microcoleus vaginatus]|uniref:type IV pilin-like G/H family protein n=1 Tax=Microcoleus vaginatus TaxID=119532 RepID=UPI0016894CDC|nr:type IV pilin-like G/H family protein [Microcoleus sp. FACHB-84]MBD2008353.1 type IV pilin-like G/H family protein [Microcoleus sp. FACHB-45]
MTKYQESSISNSAYNGCGCLLLLMGIVVIGAIALPSFLNGSNKPMISKAKQSEAKQYVGSMNKAQQAYFADNNAFSSSLKALGLGIKTETTNFKYSIRATKKAAFNYAVSKQKDLKSYVGGVFLVPAKNFEPNAAKEEITTTSILCEAESPGTIKPAEPTYENGKIACGKGTKQLSK